VTTSDFLDISDLDEAAVLAALYNASGRTGPLGFLIAALPLMTVERAAEILQSERSFDYLEARVMKVEFFDPTKAENERNKRGHLRGAWLYDRDNGDGAVARVLAALRAKAAVQ
jgi:hypothetical protein